MSSPTQPPARNVTYDPDELAATGDTDLLDQAARQGDWRLAPIIVGNPACGGHTLEVLATDSDLIEQVLTHPNCPTHLIGAAAASRHPSHRAAAAEAPNLTAKHAEILAGDSDSEVRLEIAGNEATPTRIIDQLTADANGTVAHAAAANPQLSAAKHAELVSQPDHRLLPPALANPQTSLATLRQHRDHPSRWIRTVIAGHDNIDVDTLTWFANNEVGSDEADPADRWVLWQAIAANLKTPVEILTRLACHDDVTVRLETALNPNCPYLLAIEIAASDPIFDGPGNLRDFLIANHPDPDVARIAGRLNHLGTLEALDAAHRINRQAAHTKTPPIRGQHASPDRKSPLGT